MRLMISAMLPFVGRMFVCSLRRGRLGCFSGICAASLGVRWGVIVEVLHRPIANFTRIPISPLNLVLARWIHSDDVTIRRNGDAISHDPLLVLHVDGHHRTVVRFRVVSDMSSRSCRGFHQLWKSFGLLRSWYT